MGTFGLRKEELLLSAILVMILLQRKAECPCVGLTYGYNYGESIALSEPNCVLTTFF